MCIRDSTTIGNYLQTNNFNTTIGNYLQTNNFNSTINNYLSINNFNSTINNYLQTNNFNSTINNYLLTTNFNTTIGNYLLTNNFNTTIGNYLQTNNFNTTINNYLLTNNFNNTISSYLKTSDFNNTAANFVNTSNEQTINGEKTFSNTVLVKNGRGSIKVYPQTGQIGPATFHTYRYADQAMPSQGDHWEFGQDIISNIEGFEWLSRNFVFACGGGGILTPRFSINPSGLVSVLDPNGSFYSAVIDTSTLRTVSYTHLTLPTKA